MFQVLPVATGQSSTAWLLLWAPALRCLHLARAVKFGLTNRYVHAHTIKKELQMPLCLTVICVG